MDDVCLSACLSVFRYMLVCRYICIYTLPPVPPHLRHVPGFVDGHLNHIAPSFAHLYVQGADANVAYLVQRMVLRTVDRGEDRYHSPI